MSAGVVFANPVLSCRNLLGFRGAKNLRQSPVNYLQWAKLGRICPNALAFSAFYAHYRTRQTSQGASLPELQITDFWRAGATQGA